MEIKYKNNTKIFRAFCDENRLMILEMLQVVKNVPVNY